jgi:RND family efflux transporter MFP subunit
MRKIIIASIIPLLFACSAKELDKSEQLKQYKSELTKLKKKISKLEKTLKKEAGEEESINVVASTVKASNFEHFVQVTGNVEADKNISLAPETSGNIISINVKEGQKVKKGDILGVLNTDQIQRSIDEIKTNLKLSTTLFERQKRLWDQKIGSEVEFLKAKTEMEALEKKLAATKAQKELAIIKAPFSGIVDEIFLKKGESARPSTPFAQLVNIDKVYIEGDVSENLLNYIKAGEMAKINFPAINHNTEATIYRTSNVIDPANRSFKIRINLNNPNHIIKPNLVSVMKIKDYEIEEAIVVPSIIIKKDFEGNYLYTAVKENGKSKAKKVYVDVSKTYNNLSLVEGGLSFGDQIITEGFSQVVNGSLINIK